MARRKKLLKTLFGILLGFLLSQLLLNNRIVVNNQQCLIRNKNRPPKRELLADISPTTPDKNLIFVGVMTAAKYLNTRAKAVYETWGRKIPGKTIFYSSEDSYSDEIPLVALKDVDDSYPPQKKSFHMLKHMYDNYIDQFEWFLRADDDVYIRTDRLEELLRSVDSTKAWFIGQTGRGNSEEFGLLSLEDDENFCMGGPGVIFSRETLKRIAPYVDECLNNVYTTHEDVELGRCVRKFAGISCTWSYEMQVILYHNQSGSAAFTGDLKQKEVHRAITLHPVKQPQYMYRLHKYVKALKIQEYQQECINLHRDIAVSMAELGYRRERLENVELVENLPLFPNRKGSDDYLGDITLLGMPQSLTRYKPPTLNDVLEWELISKTLYSHYDLNPRRRIGTSMKEGLSDVVRDIMEIINSYSKQRGRIIDFKEILYGYWRLDPLHGVDLILDLLLVYRKYRGHKMTVQVRRHAYIQQTFTGVMVREIKNFDFPNILQNSLPSTSSLMTPVHQQIIHQMISTFQHLQPILQLKTINQYNNNNYNYKNNRDQEIINFILPLSGRYETVQRFLKVYETICINQEDNARLIIVLYNSDDFDRTKILINNLKKRHINHRINTIEILNETFTRAKALEYGIESLNNDDLMVFIDVDIIFDTNSLQRFRLNTIKNKSIYFPIVYSQYNPKLLKQSNDNYTKLEKFESFINEDNGYWRQFGFGIVSLYKDDYKHLGGLNLLINGWGMEDVNFYDNAIKSNLLIIRTTDPGLIHIYHPVYCDINLDQAQMNMCIGSQINTLGSLRQLQRIYKKYQHLFR